MRDLKDAKFWDIGAEAAGEAYRAKILAAMRRSYRRAEGLTTAAVVTSFSGGPAPFCVPGYVTNDVVVAMVISFMERQPERMYEDFAALDPRPCKRHGPVSTADSSDHEHRPGNRHRPRRLCRHPSRQTARLDNLRRFLAGYADPRRIDNHEHARAGTLAIDPRRAFGPEYRCPLWAQP